MITCAQVHNLTGKRIKFRNREFVVLSVNIGRKYYNVQMTDDDGKVYTLRLSSLTEVSIVENKKTDAKVQKESAQKVSDWQDKRYKKQSSWMDQVYDQGIKPGDTALVRIQGRSMPQEFTIDKITPNGIVSHWPNGRPAIIKSHQIAGLKKEETKKQVVTRRRRKSRQMTLADLMRGM